MLRRGKHYLSMGHGARTSSNGMKLRKEKCRVNITNKFPVLKPTGIRLFQDKW